MKVGLSQLFMTKERAAVAGGQSADSNREDATLRARASVAASVVETDVLLRCRISNCVADDDAPSCGFADFSSIWRKRFSHLCGGS
jgi:hypothetical protein